VVDRVGFGAVFGMLGNLERAGRLREGGERQTRDGRAENAAK
jgi:hypothetical protein